MSRAFRNLLAASAVALAATAAGAQTESKKEEGGKWLDGKGNPTFNIKPDGTVDWYTFSGFRRYHSECHVCHGPEGEGSTYAPALVDSIKRGLTYDQFIEVVASGRINTAGGRESVMPALGDNKNVWCYVEDIWVYLRARAEGGLPRGRPAKRDEKPQAAGEYEKICLGQ